MTRNGSGPVVSTHLFTFHSPRDAARSLTRDRARLPQVPGLRFARLIFVGARRSEHMAPGGVDPRRQMAMCMWDDAEALQRFHAHSPLARRWREQTDQHCEVRMLPFRAHGTYRGLAPLAGLPPQQPPAGPIAMLTFANIPVRGLPYFYRGLRRSIGPLLASPGLVAAAGGPERSGRGGMTFTIWDSLPEALGFSYRRDPHRGIVHGVREHRRLIDSMFIRLRPYAIEGDWFPASRFAGAFEALARSMPGTPAAAPPAASPPDRPARSPTA
jgi:hypothetical protein